jgi:pilus assembly protein CpaB
MTPARIIVLLIALVAGGFAAILAWRPEPPPRVVQAPPPRIETVDVLVAANDIPLGQSLSGNELRWQAWPAAVAGPQFIRRQDQPDAVDQLAGSIARSPFYAGEPIRESRLIKGRGAGYMAAVLPSGMRAIATEISPESGVAGFILPNDRVDVILSRREREGERASGIEAHSTETVLSNIRVLAVDQTIEEKGGQRVIVGRTATLEVTQAQAETLVRARTMGQLSLALRSIADAAERPGAETDDHRKRKQDAVNIVRFGVSSAATAK